MSLQHVVHIPVPGPDPYNTLVYVGGPVMPTTGLTGMIGHMMRGRLRYDSDFKLIGFDPRVDVSFEHSTTVWISSIGPQKHSMFQIGVDSVVDAGFDDTDGTFFVMLDIAFMVSGGLSETCLEYVLTNSDPPTQQCVLWEVPFTVQISSYVLVYEPPPPGGHALRGPRKASAAEFAGTPTRLSIEKPHRATRRRGLTTRRPGGSEG